MLLFKKTKNSKQRGQSLIETIAATMILATALTAGLGMAIYALNSTTSARNRVIAINLAREGVDVARMLRDSNWLAAGASGPPSACADIGNRPCFPAAFSSPINFNLASNPANARNRLRFDPQTRLWTIDVLNGNETYGLCLQADGTYLHNDTGSSGITCNNPQFYRRVRFATRTGTPPYNYSSSDLDNAEVIVQSIVQWGGKNCPAVDPQNITNSSGNCKVIVEERLTNWKDYR
jgi:type II secretory pathway pseudopilin PulG